MTRGRRFRWVVPLAAAVVAAGGCGGDTPLPSGPVAGDVRLPGREIIRADFETGGLQQWTGGQVVDDDRIRAVRSPVDQGRFAG
ncbi:MAG: hypothetical protein ACLGI3_00085, partial [Actinomycetes bacterium]